jgi:hypothetical protein
MALKNEKKKCLSQNILRNLKAISMWDGLSFSNM